VPKDLAQNISVVGTLAAKAGEYPSKTVAHRFCNGCLGGTVATFLFTGLYGSRFFSIPTAPTSRFWGISFHMKSVSGLGSESGIATCEIDGKSDGLFRALARCI
jgi:hypothetical protein